MGKLAPSLKRLFKELDAKWPHRDHTTDGWYADPRERKTKGHNPGHNGYSHAIDVDKDGISPMWIINNIVKAEGVLWYIIWNHTLYSHTYNWVPQSYKGKNPHTDHMHIEIYQTDKAELWSKSWGINDTDGDNNHGGGSLPSPAPDTPTPPDFGADYSGRDYRSYLTAMGDNSLAHANLLSGLTALAKQLRK